MRGASGAVGLAVVQLAAAAGINVIGTAGSPAGLAAVTAAGAIAAINHATGARCVGCKMGRALSATHNGGCVMLVWPLGGGADAKECEAALSEALGGRGADVIIEMLANENLAADCRLVAAGGRIVVVGSRGEVRPWARLGGACVPVCVCVCVCVCVVCVCVRVAVYWCLCTCRRWSPAWWCLAIC